VDLAPPPIVHDRVQFLAGDCRTLDTLFGPAVLGPALLDSAPRPWLVIEDAHVNVLEVLRHFHRHLASGDYLVVEDSEHKRDALAQFAAETAGCYQVDTRYTDFFGRNATSAADAVLRRT
jgi:cephalosporin hydroxylase